MEKEHGKRLKEERERLGMSQADFAKACGVGRTAQFNYESGKRTPDGDYLYEAGELGVDTGYVLFGERSTPNSLYSLGVASVLPSIAERAGINTAALMGILDLAAVSESNTWGTPTGPTLGGEDQIELENALFEDGELLAEVMDKIAVALHFSNKTIALDKRIRAILMLYRSFKASGKVDQKMVDEAINLAS
ncbi:MAG: helix-turn-helix domain-containing protein [Sulfuricellaceae bacterium]|nr:helix-turn-helix domain-containing protein [Sulfuricellaceae bacterium]